MSPFDLVDLHRKVSKVNREAVENVMAEYLPRKTSSVLDVPANKRDECARKLKDVLKESKMVTHPV